MSENIERDPNLDLKDVVVDTPAANKEAVKPETDESPLAALIRSREEEDGEEDTPLMKAVKKEELTELEKAMKAKKESSGFEVDPEKEDEGRGFLNIHDTEENRAGFQEAADEQLNQYEKIKRVYVKKRPLNEKERAEMMIELDSVTIGEDGIAIVPPDSVYFIAKTPELEEQYKQMHEKMENGETIAEEERLYDNGESYVKRANKDTLVRLIIDKSGLGGDFTFDDEEKKAIEETKVIHLVEIEDKDLNTTTYQAADDEMPFLQAIDTYQLSTSKTPMTFVGSGFKADMTGLSFGEYSDIGIEPEDDTGEDINFETMNERFSIIYNHMINKSCGNFANYSEFLHNFAFIDFEPAVFGLFISTEQEEAELNLSCPNCGKGFVHKYSPRCSIDFSNSNTYYLERLKEMSELDPKDYLKYALNSPVRRGRKFKLNQSGYIVDARLMNCFDYLYNYIPAKKAIFEEEREYCEENNIEYRYGYINKPGLEKKNEILDMFISIHSITIPQKNGEPIEFKDFGQMIDIILHAMPPADMKILRSIYIRYILQFTVSYAIKDIVCPHCGTKTSRLQLSPASMVFLASRDQENTLLAFDNFKDT